METHILFIGTQPEAHLMSHLQSQGFRITHTDFPAAVLPMRKADTPDAVLIDLSATHIADEAGQEQVRMWSRYPILVLGPKQESDIELQMLSLGADDYVAPPYTPDTVLARLRAILRRIEKASLDRQQARIDVTGLHIDLVAKRVEMDGQSITMTKTEFALLACLAEHVDVVCTHDRLLLEVWGWECWDSTHYVHVYLARLRKKLGMHYSKLIETVPGVGYVMRSAFPVSRSAS